MSNYMAKARTNYFGVKNAEALKTELRRYGIDPQPWSAVQTGADFIFDDETAGKVAFFCDGTWPSLEEDAVADRLEADVDEQVPQDHIDLPALVAAHIEDGQVAIFMDIGSEKMRYLGATAVAVNAADDRRIVDLQDIYGLARELAAPGTVIGAAEN